MRKDQTLGPRLYPIADLLEGFDSAKPFLVDVGGGNGRDVLQLAEHLTPTYPEVNFVLQDQGSVLSCLPRGALLPQIECMPHDSFQPDPVHGARAYFLHSILHDWPEEFALQILLAIEPALNPPTPDYL